MKLHHAIQLIRETNEAKYDQILVKLCDMIDTGQENDDQYYGKVAACVIDHDGNVAYGINHRDEDQKRIHAERAAIAAYASKYDSLPDNTTIITTLSPCTEHMSDRHGASCTDLIDRFHIKQVYCGYIDPTQNKHAHKDFKIVETSNPEIREKCKAIADTFLKDVD